MNRNRIHDRDLIGVLNTLTEHLLKIKSSVEDGKEIVGELKAFFNLFSVFDDYVFIKTDLGKVINYNFANENVEIFGVYKYFTNMCQKLESNYCKININGVSIIDGVSKLQTLYLSNLLDPRVKLLTENSTHEDGCYVSKTELLCALTCLIDHYQLILKLF